MEVLELTLIRKQVNFNNYKLNLKLILFILKGEMSQFKTTTVEDTEMIYSLLRDKYPNRQIEIEFNDNTKEYLLSVTDKEFKEDPEVPVDIKIKIIYGDTDSVFLSLKYNRQDFTKNRADTFKLATICGDNLTDQVFNRKPIEMEFEKVFQPFILFLS